MTVVHPVRTHLVTPQWAPRVVSPLHDVLTEDQRRAVLAENPDSYLHVTSDPLPPAGAARGAQDGVAQVRALQRLLDLGAYRWLSEPSCFVYRMEGEGEEHAGVVAGVELAAFADGRVLGHERVQPARVESLLRHHERVPMRSELVALFHRADPAVAELTARVCRRPALLEFTDADGIRQNVWRADLEESADLARHLSGQRHYIADGHHRVAAALRAWERDGRPPHGSVLCASYPRDHVSLHAFHRRVRGPVAADQLVDALTSRFDVRPADGPDVPPGSIGLYADRRWQHLVPRDRRHSPGVAGLDVTILEDRILRPLLDIGDGDPRLEPLPARRGLAATIQACDADGGLLFTLHAPDIDDLISVAERHEVMSPKTTYVEPKPRTGVFLR